MKTPDWLMSWYVEQCNGEWEHGYGIEIATLDNPGWKLTIHTEGTRWAGLALDDVTHQSGHDTDWYTSN